MKHKHNTNTTIIIINIMSTIINIFTIKQKGDNLFECIDPIYEIQAKNTKPKKITTTKIITYKNIECHIDQNDNKKYYQSHNIEYLKKGNIIIQKIILMPIDELSFPIINSYDNVVTKQNTIFEDINLNIHMSYVFETNYNKETNKYIQIFGDYDISSIMDNILS